MGEEKRKGYPFQGRWMNMMENLFIVILAFYPLRHISWGIDFQDTGYNYANFRYIGTEHMDPMWLFSTYLANAAGNWLTKLPGGDTLVGMNLYTGLSVSVLALAGYFFCTRKLGMYKPVVFVGEMVAISLCWCPTAVLYNYLTYMLFLGACILLYLGLTEEGCGALRPGKSRLINGSGLLFGAGVLLGTNVLVRFSNLPEAALIVAVWAYDFIVWREWKSGKAPLLDAGSTGRFRPRALRHTFWCLAGYVAALAMLFIHIDILYGMGEYAAGIRRLFAMTDNAADYKPLSMIMGIIGRYVESMYWVVRIGAIMAGGLVLFAMAGRLEALLAGRRAGQGRSCKGGMCPAAKFIHIGVRIVWGMVCLAMLWWLYDRNFCSLLFYSYDPIWHPGPLFLMLAMFIAAIRIFHKGSSREEKLLGGMLILIILLTSIGSNNGVFPSLNNLFLAAPYVLWESWRFLRYVGDWEVKGIVVSSFPVKGILAAFLGLCLFLFGCFGAEFVFAEGTGVRDVEVTVDNNDVLQNVRMSPDKALWMRELSAYVNENGLEGREVILYGKIPALSYYLQMPSAFNPWSDLPSYSLGTMEGDMEELAAGIAEKGAEKPLVIVEKSYALYEEGGVGALAEARLDRYIRGGSKSMGCVGAFREIMAAERECRAMAADGKWQLITDFMERFDYKLDFDNAKFAVYR